ncbi:TnsA endonuclease N-terminal domain-containing protein [Rhodanobacter koreensis]
MNLIDVSVQQHNFVSNTHFSSSSLEALRDHIGRMALAEEGEAYVMSVASSPPSRSVGEHRVRNLVGDIPIPHLGVVLQMESGSGEYFFLLEMLRRGDVIAIYDQPQGVPLLITNKAGVRTRTTHTPDFLVVHEDHVAVYEVKADEAIESNCRQRKADWYEESGKIVYAPARAYFERLGIQHRVIANSATSAVRADNLRTLIAVRSFDDTPRLARLRERIANMVQSADLIQIGQVLDRLHIEDSTAMFQLLDRGAIYADLDHCLLSSPRDVWVSHDPSLPSLLSNTGFRFKDAIATQGSVSTEHAPHPKHIGEVAARYAACGLIDQVDGLAQKSARTKRRYKRTLREHGGDPCALFPRWDRCGNRRSRISVEHKKLLDEVIEATKGDPNLSTPSNGYLEYCSRYRNSSIKDHDRPIAGSTFHRHYRYYGGHADLARRRGGRRAGNAAASSIDPLRRTLLPTRAFSIAHIDHYNVDVALLLGHAKDKPITKRAWLTGMVDAYSGEVLGLWLSYKAPCRNSCAMVIRDCVARHGRLPEILVVDGGPELDSVHFTTLLASLSVTRIQRPPEDPRFGKEIERLFGAFKENFARGLPGFIPGVAHARKMSGKLSASKRARLKFHELIDLLDAYTFRGYNHEPKPDAIESRLSMRAKCDAAFPFSGRRILLDTRFLIQSAVDAPANCYQLVASRGIRVYGTWYGSPALYDYRGPKKHVQVRIEPFDSSIAYVCLAGLWHVCRSTSAAINDARPTTEVIWRTAEHHELRSLAASLARDAELAAYEEKRSALHSLVGIGSAHAGKRKATGASHASPKARGERTSQCMDDVDDLMMDEEPA